jgi:hypothetical protein
LELRFTVHIKNIITHDIGCDQNAMDFLHIYFAI